MLDLFSIVIPARYDSSRFPGKPLVKILGKELILRVYEKCKIAFPNSKIYVLTDDKRIINFCKKKFIPNFKTSKKCKTGTDRIFEIKNKIKSKLFINVQGDEPLIEVKNLRKFISIALKNKNQICIGKSLINKNKYDNENIPKIVTNEKDELLYISRSTVPGSKNKKDYKIYGQVNVYSFPKVLLINKMFNKKSKNEEIEDIEILRFLEHGYKIKVVNLKSNNHAVDIPADIQIVEKILKKI